MSSDATANLLKEYHRPPQQLQRHWKYKAAAQFHVFMDELDIWSFHHYHLVALHVEISCNVRFPLLPHTTVRLYRTTASGHIWPHCRVSIGYRLVETYSTH
ncbi:Hypothetical predicted protein [Octopus vulgaris]|uniref:Uncharacterized protein n=1 Tax=Octopus vulgaris TaxID=6645 RepID=A0AA36BDZ6_OCTVU|nr:Hypothetical predicted protein [Octopus vulgaris]